ETAGAGTATAVEEPPAPEEEADEVESPAAEVAATASVVEPVAPPKPPVPPPAPIVARPAPPRVTGPVRPIAPPPPPAPPGSAPLLRRRQRPAGGPGAPLAGPGGPPGRRRRRYDRATRGIIAPAKEERPTYTGPLRKLTITEAPTVKELGEKMPDVKSRDIMKMLISRGIMATVNQVLEPKIATDICKEFGYEASVQSFEEEVVQEQTVES